QQTVPPGLVHHLLFLVHYLFCHGHDHVHHGGTCGVNLQKVLPSCHQVGDVNQHNICGNIHEGHGLHGPFRGHGLFLFPSLTFHLRQ
ncbi:hypothetical protein, partial [Klebsiella pneumoniae]|uniref:hypothetical protein n=1 Tax=Klebsiella pneumoniae TaxID=573 RepID=UPI003A866F0E